MSGSESLDDVPESADELVDYRKLIATLLDGKLGLDERKVAMKELRAFGQPPNGARDPLFDALASLAQSGDSTVLAELLMPMLRPQWPLLDPLLHAHAYYMERDRRIASPVRIPAEVSNALERMLVSSDDPQIRATAAEAFKRFSANREIELQALVRTAISDPDASVRRAAIRTIFYTGDASVIGSLKSIVALDPDAGNRALAEKAIEWIESRPE